MMKPLMALAAAATLGIAAGGLPAPAQAHDGLGVGLAAGLLGGAIVGGAVAGGPGYYGYGPGYYYRPAPAYVVGPGYYGDCYWQRQRFWDGFGWRIRSVRVCE